MTSLQIAQEKNRRIQAAMFPLIADPRFIAFMDTVEELKEESIEFAVNHDSAKEERVCLAALGEVRAYKNLLAIFDGYQDQLSQERNRLDARSEQAH